MSNLIRNRNIKEKASNKFFKIGITIYCKEIRFRL